MTATQIQRKGSRSTQRYAHLAKKTMNEFIRKRG